ncbi:MAG: hypothetical protein RR738_12465 [Anaerorhabdus sp.]|uniref:hypothetical protein n=1 Tax=Anaerorhabdus sp. TaxID=1872524 RepID=UPI002FC722E2
MNKLDICENKKLVLSNVIIQSFTKIKVEDLQNCIDTFVNDLLAMKVKIKGPIITRYGEISFLDNNVYICVDLFIQLENHDEYTQKFMYKERFVCEECLYLRFEGNPKELEIIDKKFDVYCYENSLISKQSQFVVVLEESETYIKVDYFRELAL